METKATIEGFRRFLDLIKSSPILQVPEQSQSSEASFYDALEPISNYPNPDPVEQTQSDEDLLGRSPEPISSSPPEVDTSDETPLSDDYHQPLELIPTSPIFDSTEYSHSNNESLHHLVLVSSSSPINIHDPVPLSGESQQLSEPHSILQILDIAEQPQCIYKYFRQPSGLNPTSPALDATEHSQPNHDGPLKPFSSSPGIDTPDHTKSKNKHLSQSPERMATSSLLSSTSHSQFRDSSLHQPLELVLPSPNLMISEQHQPGYHSLDPPPELISTLPILNAAAIQPYFRSNYLQQSLEGIPTSLMLDAASHSQAGDEDDDDLKPLEYARKHGLSRDYLKEPYLISNLDVFGDYQDGLTDDSHFPQFKLTTNVNTDERLSISKDATLLIASVSREETSGFVDNAILRMIESRKRKNILLELPLLKSDHETDCNEFAQKGGFEIKLQNVKLPLEVVDEKNNGGLGFSPSLWNQGTKILENLKREKLEVSKDTLVYLQNIFKNDWTEEDKNGMWASVHIYKRNTALKPVTPPLSPMAFPAQPYGPSMSDPVFELPILSDPESLIKQDLEAIETQIFDEDVPTPVKNAMNCYDGSSDTLVGSDIFKLAHIYSPAASLDRPPIYPGLEIERFKREELKVEEPLSPAQPTDLPKSIRFSEMVIEWPVSTGTPLTDPFESSYFEEAFGAAHEEAAQMSEQEGLIPADTTARVDVPIIDFSLPVPPWNALQSKLNSSSLLDMQKVIMMDIIGNSLPKWPFNGKAKIRYNPFPHNFAKIALEEDFVGDDLTWKAFVKNPEDDKVIDTSTLTWKPPGLRILRDVDDDDEIEPGQFEKGVPQDLSFLVKKRKIEIEEGGRVESSVAQDALTNVTAKQPARKKSSKPTDFVSAAKELQLDRPIKGGSLLMGRAFSVGNLVENYLEIRGSKKAKLGDSSYFAKISGPAKAQPTPAKSSPQLELLLQLPIRSSPVLKTDTPLPAPPNKIPNTPVNVIVASTLLKHRALIKYIEDQFPRIVLIERDFSAHDTTVWMPNSVTRSPIASPLASEADIIVSPLVGIIIANLQKIKQKPLPGQKTKPVIRERLEKVSARYEKLIVLVTEGRQDETTRELDDSDCTAFSEFVGFALCLQTTINVHFVGGGETTLAKWLVNAIAQHKVDDELLADETHWELFLRRAGLNAFVAQHIIGNLKAPNDVDLSSPSNAAHFGLAAFVGMGREQRIARFGPVCGNQLMTRVSAVVDTRWS